MYTILSVVLLLLSALSTCPHLLSVINTAVTQVLRRPHTVDTPGFHLGRYQLIVAVCMHAYMYPCEGEHTDLFISLLPRHTARVV